MNLRPMLFLALALVASLPAAAEPLLATTATTTAAPLSGPDALGLLLIAMLAIGLREHDGLDDA